MGGRDPVRGGALDQYRDEPDFARAEDREKERDWAGRPRRRSRCKAIRLLAAETQVGMRST